MFQNPNANLLYYQCTNCMLTRSLQLTDYLSVFLSVPYKLIVPQQTSQNRTVRQRARSTSRRICNNSRDLHEKESPLNSRSRVISKRARVTNLLRSGWLDEWLWPRARLPADLWNRSSLTSRPADRFSTMVCDWPTLSSPPITSTHNV